MGKIKTLISLRHGVYARNKRIDSIGGNRQKEYDPDDDYTENLLSEGIEQCKEAQEVIHTLARGAISLCLYSPYLRTKTSAEVVFKDTDVVLLPDLNLRERNLADLTELSRQEYHERYAKLHPEHYAYKFDHPLDWRPPGKGGETLREVGERVLKSIERADRLTPDGIVVFSTHSDTKISLRSLERLSGFTNEDLMWPFTEDHYNLQWIQNGEVSAWTREDPFTGELEDDMRFFRSVVPLGKREFDTGWLQVR